MEKNPSILRFGSLSVKVSSSLLLVCLKFEIRWRRPPRRSTTILVAAMRVRQSWSGKITTEIKKRCRPRNLPRWDLLLGFPICICFPNSGCRWRSAVILSVQLTLVELNLPLLPLWREVQSKRFYKNFVAILDVSYVRWLWKKEKSWEVTATLNMVLGTDGEEKLLQRLEDLWLKALSRGRPRGEGNTDEERGLLCQWKSSFHFWWSFFPKALSRKQSRLVILNQRQTHIYYSWGPQGEGFPLSFTLKGIEACISTTVLELFHCPTEDQNYVKLKDWW